MKATHTINKGKRPCMAINTEILSDIAYMNVVIPFSPEEIRATGNTKGFHVQTIQASKLSKINIGPEYSAIL